MTTYCDICQKEQNDYAMHLDVCVHCWVEASTCDDETLRAEALAVVAEHWPSLAPSPVERTERCAYCGADIPVDMLDAPDGDADSEWQEMAHLHYASCEWVATRAHRDMPDKLRGYASR